MNELTSRSVHSFTRIQMHGIQVQPDGFEGSCQIHGVVLAVEGESRGSKYQREIGAKQHGLEAVTCTIKGREISSTSSQRPDGEEMGASSI